MIFGSIRNQKNLKQPNKAPEKHQKNSEPPQKHIKTWTPKLTCFGWIFKHFWAPNWITKLHQKATQNKPFLFFCNLVLDHMNVALRSHAGPLLGPKMDQPFCTKSNKNLRTTPRWAQERHQRLQHVDSCLSKILKNPWFFSVCGSRDLPRDTHGPQEPPKKHPKSSKDPYKKPPKKVEKMPPW